MSEIAARLSTALADRYRIERQIGEGGMATVYLADDLKHKRKVAVKVLRPELAAVETAVHRALAKLPADRFATVAEFAEVLDGRRVATPVGGVRSAQLLRSVTPLRVGLAGAVVGALLATTAFLIVGRPAPERVEHILEGRREGA